MKLYFVVEGETTEMQLYPKWISYLLPELTKSDSYKKIEPDSYYLFCGRGMPQIYRHTANAVRVINSVGDYDYLIVCLDGENAGVAIREKKLRDYLEKDNAELTGKCKLRVVVQNASVETWFLGNRKAIRQNPEGSLFREYTEHYNVRDNDPELMDCKVPFTLKAQFHLSYLREAFKEHKLSYSKSRPGHVLDKTHMEELLKRTNDYPKHLQSLKGLFDLISEIRDQMKSTQA